jgi:hypothetical protein
MVNGAKVALAVGAGYLLGRRRKMRLALMMAAAGITGKFPTSPSALAAQGLKSLGASADVSELSQQLRGELLNAARAAALAAATKQIDSLNDRLQGVTSAVGADEVLEDVGDTVGSVGDTVGVGEPLRSVGRLGRRPSAEQDEDLYDQDQDNYEDEPLDVEEDVDDEDREQYDADFDEDQGEDEDAGDLDEEDVDEAEPTDEDDRPLRSRRRATRQETGPRTSGRRSSGAASSDEPPAAPSRRARGTAAKAAPVRRGR